MAAVLRSILGFPLCCFPCLGKGKKNLTQGSGMFGDLCGSSETQEKCPLFKFLKGSNPQGIINIFHKSHVESLSPNPKRFFLLNECYTILLF